MLVRLLYLLSLLICFSLILDFMFFAKKFTQKSFPDIGRSFGGRDHATVIHAVKQIENFIRTDSKFC